MTTMLGHFYLNSTLKIIGRHPNVNNVMLKIPRAFFEYRKYEIEKRGTK